MMLPNRDGLRQGRVKRILAFLSVLTVVAWASVFALIWPRAAEPMPYSVSFFTEAEWLDFARERVRFEGLVGEPDSEEWALMSFGSYLTLTDNPYDDTTLSREAPVFVYQAFGSIPELKWFGGDGPHACF